MDFCHAYGNDQKTNTGLEIDQTSNETPQSSKAWTDASELLTNKEFYHLSQRMEKKLTRKIQDAVSVTKN